MEKQKSWQHIQCHKKKKKSKLTFGEKEKQKQNK